MALKPVSQKPLDTIRAQEEELKAKDSQLQQLGLSLAQEKAKNIQKDAQINSMGKEIAQMKVDLLILKGAVGK